MSEKRIAQYKIIEDNIRRAIAEGRYKQGDFIPTELEFSETYQVSRVTVRRATDNLVAQDILQRVAGVGTFVKNTAVHRKVPSLMGFTDEITGMGMTPRTDVVAFQLVKAPDALRHRLRLDEDEPVYFIVRHRYADGDLLMVETTHMSARLYPNLSVQVLQGSKYHYFERELGLKIAYSQHTVTPIHPPAAIARLFGISTGTPVVRVGNTTFLENGQIMDYTELVMNSPKYQLRYIKQ